MASLATKYRPKYFEDMIEQRLTVQMIQKLCSGENLNNRNFLLIGPAGVGKTSTAKVMARVLNGDTYDPIELDAASHSGVDSVRDIIQQARSYPVGSKYKVFILDEVHAFSQSAWQALLTTLESGPAMSVFVLCLDGDGLVYTEKGLVPLKDIHSGDKVWDGSKYQNVLNVFDNGEKPTLKLKLSNGSYINCTPNHQISVLDVDKLVWKRADEISVGDYVLDYYNGSNYSSNSICSTEEAWFLGYLTGNGNYTSHSMDLYTPFKKWDKVKEYLDELVTQGIIKDYIQSTNEDAVKNHIFDTRIHFYSDKYHPGMTNWYNKVGADPNYARGTKSIPKVMFSESIENIRAFVDGWYFADGDGSYDSFFENARFDKDTNKWISNPAIYCSNKQMLSDLQQLIRLIGLHASVKYYKATVTDEDYAKSDFIKPGDYEGGTIYLLNQYGFVRNDKLKSLFIDKYNAMPKGVNKYRLDLSNIRIPERNISPTMFTEAGYDYTSKGRFFPVTSIEQSDIKHVYDIEVENTHQFVYNGVLVHNCTTNPEKIPATILSRVQTFQLSKISLDGIISRLKYVIDCENKEGRNITYEDSAITYIAKLAGGGMRDALTLLEKALAYSEDLTSKGLMQALNLPSYDDYFLLLASYAKHNNEEIAKLIHKVYNSGVNFVKWFEGFHAFVINIVKYIFMQDIECTMIPSHYKDKVSNYGPKHSIICLKLANKLLKLNAELKTTSYLQEVALTYLCEIPRKEG